jgi:hypothetical protein
MCHQQYYIGPAAVCTAAAAAADSLVQVGPLRNHPHHAPAIAQRSHSAAGVGAVAVLLKGRRKTSGQCSMCHKGWPSKAYGRH